MNFDQTGDARARRSKKALRDAFFRLVLEKPYGEIAISDIVATAGVARSTFYQHFRSLDDLLQQSLAGPMSMLASGSETGEGRETLESILSHFWDNRSLARHVFTGAPRRVAVSSLAAELEKSLEKELKSRARRYPFSVSRAVCCQALAEMLLSLVMSWLAGRAECTLTQLAQDIARLKSSVLLRQGPEAVNRLS